MASSSAAASKTSFLNFRSETSNRNTRMDSSSFSSKGYANESGEEMSKQHVIVMRHGDRMDNVDPTWTTTAERPWDPPLADSGKDRAFVTGTSFRANLGFPIHRVFVSPFLRCIHTASEVIKALLPSSKVKVSVESGLCEVLSKEAIRVNWTPGDGDWGFNVSELDGLLPPGTVDQTVGCVDQKLPKWGEPTLDARARYVRVIKALADKFPNENLLLVTHGEGVGAAVSAFLEGVTVYEVEYCGYSHLQRQISINSNPQNFELVTKSGRSGVAFCPH